jgi:succinoglycan biosynthesis protein ExoO
MPDVSFIIAAYNVELFIEAAVTSALQQTDVTVEVIVVDDASSDQTADKVAALAGEEARLTLLRRKTRGGPSAARNAAMDAARGSWLAILDSDDLVAPQRSRRLLDLAAATSADVVADNFERFSDQGGHLSTMIESGPQPYAFFVDIATFLKGNAMFDSNARLGYIKPMLRTEFVRANNLRYQEEILIGEDYHLLLSCLLAGARFAVTSESLYRYRIREGSISWRLSKRDIDTLLEAHSETGLDERFRDSDDIKAASRTYVRALERARVIAEIIEDTKARNWPKALASTAGHPETWLQLARFGSAAVEKRLRRRT